MKEYGELNSGLTINVSIENVHVNAGGRDAYLDEEKLCEWINEVCEKIAGLKDKLEGIESRLKDTLDEETAERNLTEFFGNSPSEDDEEDEEVVTSGDVRPISPSIKEVKESMEAWNKDGEFSDEDAQLILDLYSKLDPRKIEPFEKSNGPLTVSTILTLALGEGDNTADPCNLLVLPFTKEALSDRRTLRTLLCDIRELTTR